MNSKKTDLAPLKTTSAKKIDMKFLPKVSFVSDKSFDYAEKIEKLIQKNK